MPKLNDKAMAERRRRIAQAAYRCFVRDGYVAASVDGICAEAGISKGAFYVHYRSKQELIRAVADLRGETIAPLPGATPDALADAIFDNFIVDMLAPAVSRFEVEAMVRHGDDPVLAARVTANLAAIAERIAQALTRIATAQALVLTMPAAAAADIVESYCLGLILGAAVSEAPEPTAVCAAMRHLISSLFAPAHR